MEFNDIKQTVQSHGADKEVQLSKWTDAGT